MLVASVALQVASKEAVIQDSGREALASPDKFLEALSRLESTTAYVSERAVVDLQLVWNLATEVSL